MTLKLSIFNTLKIYTHSTGSIVHFSEPATEVWKKKNAC